MAVLYCVPLGCTARRLFYEQMGQQDYEDSILVLPNRQLRLQAQKEAAAEMETPTAAVSMSWHQQF